MISRPATLRPNLLLICTDTQRCDTLGVYGSRVGNTPRLDAFGAKHLVLDRAYTVSPVCGPARCSLLTGLYPPSHGAIENGFERHADLPTLVGQLKQHGYRCGVFGKTHFGPVPDAFERHVETPDPAHGTYPQRDAAAVDAALAWIGDHDDRPTFAFVSLHMPHEPFQPTDEAVAAVDREDLPPLNFATGDAERRMAYLSEDLNVPGHDLSISTAYFPGGTPDRPAIDEERRRYFALAGMIDAQVGRLLDGWIEAGLDVGSGVVFTSDHGSTLFDRGFKDKHCFFDEAWRVPMLIRPPMRAGDDPVQPRRVGGFFGWTDLTATMVGWAGGDLSPFQGFDMSRELAEADRPWPRVAQPGSVFHTLALVTDQAKLIYDTRRQTGQLFLTDDPAERHDLWGDPNQRRQRDTLLTALLSWRANLHVPTHAAQRFGRGGPVADAALAVERGIDANLADRLLQEAVRRCQRP
jgi:arylsulfatase A-like enzyme